MIKTRDNPFGMKDAESKIVTESIASPHSLSELTKKEQSSMLNLLCGLPCSGKSTWVKKSLSPNDIVLCPDDFRMVLTGHEYYAPAEDSVWSHVKIAARVLLKSNPNKTIIVDATHLTVGSRAQWLRLAKDAQVPINCLWFDVSLEECMKRMQERDRKIPEDVMQRMASSFIAPTIDEGFQYITKI